MTKRNVSILLATLLVMAGAVIAGSGRNISEIPAPPAIGATIEEFTLPDVDGRDHSLKSTLGGSSAKLRVDGDFLQ